VYGLFSAAWTGSRFTKRKTATRNAEPVTRTEHPIALRRVMNISGFLHEGDRLRFWQNAVRAQQESSGTFVAHCALLVAGKVLASAM
jgi:hypothetical protein